jgi:hypothetical protein
MESGKYEGVWSCCITRRDDSLDIDKNDYKARKLSWMCVEGKTQV